ncbi:MAG TPA: ankyrin repeat domain-containing protein [Patescibacteria group bacterium]|nr:ankyrin repeat domain-containing protein [Patescibacteria group bacterium]
MTDARPTHEDLLWRDLMRAQPAAIQAETAFQMAEQGDLWRLTQLLDMGVPVDSESAVRESAVIQSLLHVTVAKGHHALAVELLKRGADVNLPDEASEFPLNKAVRHSDHAMVSLLLLNHANPLQKNEFGYDALALARHKPEIREMLEEAVPKRGISRVQRPLQAR